MESKEKIQLILCYLNKTLTLGISLDPLLPIIPLLLCCNFFNAKLLLMLPLQALLCRHCCGILRIYFLAKYGLEKLIK